MRSGAGLLSEGVSETQTVPVFAPLPARNSRSPSALSTRGQARAPSRVNPLMSTLQRCMESLAVCHLQDEPHWPAARSVARQDIDAYLREAGPQLADRRQAIDLLAQEFALKFPDETDPVLIRSYMRQIDSDLRREAERMELGQAAQEPAISSSGEEDKTPGESEGPMTEQQRRDIARLCHEANIPDKSGEQLSAKSAQQLIDELREKAAEHARK